MLLVKGFWLEELGIGAEGTGVCSLRAELCIGDTVVMVRVDRRLRSDMRTHLSLLVAGFAFEVAGFGDGAVGVCLSAAGVCVEGAATVVRLDRRRLPGLSRPCSGS